MGSSWYYKWGNREIGPIPSRELLRRARRHEIHPETEVRSSESEKWIVAVRVKGLFGPLNGIGPTATNEQEIAVAKPGSSSPPPALPVPNGDKKEKHGVPSASLAGIPHPVTTSTSPPVDLVSEVTAVLHATNATPIAEPHEPPVPLQSLPQTLGLVASPQAAGEQQAAGQRNCRWFRWVAGAMVAMTLLTVVGVNVAMVVLDRTEAEPRQIASAAPVNAPTREQDRIEAIDFPALDDEPSTTAAVPGEEQAAPSDQAPEKSTPVPVASDVPENDAKEWAAVSAKIDDTALRPEANNNTLPAAAAVSPRTAASDAVLETAVPAILGDDADSDTSGSPKAEPVASPASEASQAASPPEDRTSPMESSPSTDPRLERMTEIHQSILGLGEKWDGIDKDIQGLLKEEAGLQIQYRQILFNIKQVQAEAAAVARNYQIELSRRDGRPRQYELRLRTLETQLQAIQSQGGSLEQQSQQIKAKIAEKRSGQLALNREAERWYGEWFLLSDPFGRLSTQTHNRGKTLFEEWRREHNRLPLPHVAHGFACLRLGQCEEALRDFDEVEKIFAAAPEANRQMGALMAAASGYGLRLQALQREQLAGKGNDSAVERSVSAEFAQATRRDGRLGLVYLFRAHVAILDDQHAKALKELEDGLQLAEKAEDPVAAIVYLCHDELARFLASSPYDSVRNGSRAVELATRACDMTDWRKWPHLETLAMAHAESGNFEEAINWATKALELAPSEERPPIEEKCALFRRHRPYRLGQEFKVGAVGPQTRPNPR